MAGPAAATLSSPPLRPSEAIRLLNAQRRADGIPGDLRLDARRSAGCAQHNAYIHRGLIDDGRASVHSEDPARPGFTRDGDQAARTSLVALSFDWWDQSRHDLWWTPLGNPFDHVTSGEGAEPYAPLHEVRLRDPSATRAWYAENDPAPPPDSGRITDPRVVCMGASGDRQWRRPSYFSHPGDGRSDVPPSARAVEEPLTPQQVVRLPRFAETGPQVLVWAEGLGRIGNESWGETFDGADLRSSGGPAAVRTIDALTRAPGAPSFLVVPGDVALVIPVAPLQPGTVYRLRTRWRTLDGRRFAHVTRFATRNADGTPGPPAASGFQDPSLTAEVARHASAVSVSAKVLPAALGRIVVTTRSLSRSGPSRVRSITPRGGQASATVALPHPGRWAVDVRFEGIGPWDDGAVTRTIR
jgi:hypothetical protein